MQGGPPITDHTLNEQATEATAADMGPREHDVRKLVGNGVEAVILHAGERYRLRITANNKLILTK